MTRCFSTRASVAAVLSTHPYISSYVWDMQARQMSFSLLQVYKSNTKQQIKSPFIYEMDCQLSQRRINLC